MPGGETFMSAAVNEQKPPAPAPAGQGEHVIVYQHSDLIYWWVVWAYGFVCALLTWLSGKSVPISDDGRQVLIYPGAWLGISFVALVLFVLVFTNARARGMKSLVLFLLLTVAGLAIEFLHGWNKLLGYFPLLLVHMNLAFYLLFSGLLLIAWLVVVRGSDHFTYWEFGPNSIAMKHRFSEGAESFTSPQVQTSRQSDDIFVHRLLGLWFLGFGTGDIEIRFSTAGGGQKVYFLKNVWRAAHTEKEINRLVA
jgi:hypothetical protein